MEHVKSLIYIRSRGCWVGTALRSALPAVFQVIRLFSIHVAAQQVQTEESAALNCQIIS